MSRALNAFRRWLPNSTARGHSARPVQRPDRAALLVRPAVASAAQCAEIVAAFQHATGGSEDKPTGAFAGGLRQHPHRTEMAGRYFRRIAAESAVRHLDALRHAVLAEMRAFLDDPTLIIECTLLSEMRSGDAHPLHADNERADENGRWVPNHTPWRDFAAMLLLNTSGDDYRGGILRFPRTGEQISPAAGMLVGFTCGHEREHEVVPVEGGRRYSMSIWLTSTANRAEHWPA